MSVPSRGAESTHRLRCQWLLRPSGIPVGLRFLPLAIAAVRGSSMGLQRVGLGRVRHLIWQS